MREPYTQEASLPIRRGAQRADAIVWNREGLIVFIHELCD